MGNNAPDYEDNLFFDPKADYEKLDSLAAGLVLDQELPRSDCCSICRSAIHLEKANTKLREDIKYLSQIRKGQAESIRLWIYRCEELKKENSRIKEINDFNAAWKKSFMLLGEQNTKIRYENQKIKDLLKECKDYIINTPILEQGNEIKTAAIHKLLDKIEEALK